MRWASSSADGFSSRPVETSRSASMTPGSVSDEMIREEEAVDFFFPAGTWVPLCSAVDERELAGMELPPAPPPLPASVLVGVAEKAASRARSRPPASVQSAGAVEPKDATTRAVDACSVLCGERETRTGRDSVRLGRARRADAGPAVVSHACVPPPCATDCGLHTHTHYCCVPQSLHEVHSSAG